MDARRSYTMPLLGGIAGLHRCSARSLTGRLLAAILIGAAVGGRADAAHLPRATPRRRLGLFWGLFAGFCWVIGTFVVEAPAWPGMGLSLTFWQVLLDPSRRSPSASLLIDVARRSASRRPRCWPPRSTPVSIPDGARHRHLVSHWSFSRRPRSPPFPPSPFPIVAIVSVILLSARAAFRAAGRGHRLDEG